MKVKTKLETWNFTRDMFIFCTFTGITCIDLRNLYLDIPIQIIDRYKDTEFRGTGDKIFKFQTHLNMNWQLKRLVKLAKIDKRLTFHMSRFTFATTVCLTLEPEPDDGTFVHHDNSNLCKDN